MKPATDPTAEPLGFAGRVARAFIDSKLTPLIVITSVLLGAAAVVLLPHTPHRTRLLVPTRCRCRSLRLASATSTTRATRPRACCTRQRQAVHHRPELLAGS